MSETVRALVVYESMFGNTERIARAIRDGLQQSVPTEIVPAYRAPTVVPADVRLLVVGGPTHAFSMSRPSTRQEARKQDDVVMPIEVGIREWLDALATDTRAGTGRRSKHLEVATFDTRIAKVRRLPGIGRTVGREAAAEAGVPADLAVDELLRGRDDRADPRGRDRARPQLGRRARPAAHHLRDGGLRR